MEECMSTVLGNNEKIEAYRACQLSGSIYLAPSSNGDEILTGIKDGDEAIFRYVEWETPSKEISIEATGSGEIHIYLDNENQASGIIALEKGQIVASSFQGTSGKHQIKLQFNKTKELEIHALYFR
jgi:arabinoxylan arabinofuranohydrolase